MRRIRLTAVLTHPVQYYSPWFRHVTEHAPEIDLTVIYATEPTPEQQGTGFGRAFQWDVPLREGYRSRVVREARDGDRVDSHSFFGLNVGHIGEAIRETEPDVVLVPGWHSVTLVRAILAARRLHVPVLFRGDTNLATAPTGWKGRVWRWRTRCLLALFDAYLSPGRRVREFLAAMGVEPWQIIDAPHVVDNERFAAAARPFQSEQGRARARAKWGLPAEACVLLFAGKLEEKKRPLDVIKAAARLEPRAAVLIVGAGDLEPACREEAARLGVTVAFAGFMNQSAMGEAYAAADMLVLPSDGRETWGMVVNEALATGLPVVVSDQAGCAPDLADESTGATFVCGDMTSLSNAINVVWRRSESGSYRDACRTKARRFSVEEATAGLVRACQIVARVPEGAPRVVACCGSMVTVTGLERMTFTVLRGLRQRGARVHCIVNNWENHRIVPLAEEIGATWSEGGHALPLRRRNLNAKRVIAMARDNYDSSAALSRAARRLRATHVLLPDPLSPIRNAFALARLRIRGVRIVMRLANAPDQGVFYRLYWRWFVNSLVSQFICNSDFTLRELQTLGIPPRKTERIYNALRFPPLAAAPAVERRAHHIIFVGQIIPVKGLDVLLDAVAVLNRRGVPATLSVAGDIDGWTAPEYVPFRQALRTRAAEPDLAGRVEFLGWRNDIVALMATASVHCAPSRLEQREAFGIVNLEAKRAGIPSVVFPSGALAEVINHREDGWVCPEVTPEALADGLAYFLTDEARRASAGLAATRSLARFDIGPFDQAWSAVFARPTAARRTDARSSALGHPVADGSPETPLRVVACCGSMVTVTGMERMTFTVLRGLRDQGARVHCVVNSWENHRITPLAEAIGATWSAGGATVHLRRRHLTPRIAGLMFQDACVSSASLWRAARQVRATHVLLPDLAAPIRNVFALAALRVSGVRVIMHLNNAPEQSPFYRLLWRGLINSLVTHFVCNSDFTLRELRALGIPARKTERIYNALRFPPMSAHSPVARRPNHIIYVGQVIPVKGLDLLLEAVALLNGRGVPATLSVAGDIDGWTLPEYRPFRDGLRARAEAPDLAGRVEFLGWRDDIVPLMATASVHCAPSRLEQREAFGLVNIEAKRAGIPSVVFPSGALAEVISHRDDGWVCADVTAEALAEGLAYFLTDEERRASAGRAAARSLAKFDIAAFDEAWRQVFARGSASRADDRSIAPLQRPIAASSEATE